MDELQAYAEGSDIRKRGDYLEVLNRLCIFALMKEKLFSLLVILMFLVSCKESYEHKTVICIPVYGQSLALGEEATRITDFDSLASYADGRIVTENLDHAYGYFDNNIIKEKAKRIIHYQKRSFELTIYSMAEMLADSLGKDTIICIFPGGQGTTAIKDLSKGTRPYQCFLDNIESAYKNAKEREWDFVVPAICWMQGESDIEEYPETNYKVLLKKFQTDIANDIRNITHQAKDVRIVCYQTNNVSGGRKFKENRFNCQESIVPQSQLELIKDDSLFWPSSPTYLYDFVRERIHINAIGQQLHGKFVAMSALDIIHNKQNTKGLTPNSIECIDNEVVINFKVPYPPLVFDTTSVYKIKHYGFSVISPSNKDIVQSVGIKGNSIHIKCSENVAGCKVRYAINGERMHSGRIHGPRGNLRDSQGIFKKAQVNRKEYPLHNWCWQFDIIF